MLKRKIKIVLSLVLVLSLIIQGVLFADSVYVASAPMSEQSYTSNVGNSYNLSYTEASAAASGQVYPGSLQVVKESPTVSNITSPGANNVKTKTVTGGSQSSIITNGVTWEADNNHIEPVYNQITSPGAHMRGEDTGRNTSIIDGDYSQPVNNIPPGGTTDTMSYNPNASTDYVSSLPQGGQVANTLFMHSLGMAEPVISSDGAIIVNATTREIYYGKNIEKAYAPAGLTTLLTGYILLQYKNINDVLTVSQTAVTGLESGASTIGLKAGDVITVKDALYALYIKSACDVAKVIAENVAGSEQAFVNIMNQTATNFGVKNTHFENCNGLNNNAQVTTPYDMALIMSNVIQNATLNQIMQTPTYTLPATSHRGALTITTKNDFINPKKSNYYQGIVLSRMGYTSKAKYTMGSFFIHNNQFLVAIVLYSNNTQYVDSKRLLNYGRIAVDKLGLTNGENNMLYEASVTNQNTTNITSTTNTTSSVGTTASGNYVNNTEGTWVKDVNGWYFMKINNTKAINEWIFTDGKKYCVDSNGYMITGWREFSNGDTYYFDPNSGEMKSNTWVNMPNGSGAYYLQMNGTLARATKGTTKTIATQVGSYIIDENGKAIKKVVSG